MADNQGAEGTGYHQYAQPHNTVSCQLQHRGFQIFFVGRQQCCHFFHIFRGFFVDNVHDIVYGDDTYQTVFPVYNRQGNEAVFSKQICRFFLVVQSGNRDDIFLHKFFYQFIFIGEKQCSEGQYPHQMLFVVNNITGVNGFLIQTVFADNLHGALCCHGFGKVHKLYGHQTSGGVFGIMQETVDESTGFPVCISQDFAYQIGRGFLQKVDGIVQIHIIYDVPYFRIRNGCDQHFLGVIVQEREGFCRHILGQQTEEEQLLIRRQFFQKFRHVGRVFFIQFFSQQDILSFFNKFLPLFHRFIPFFHVTPPSEYRFSCSYSNNMVAMLK